MDTMELVHLVSTGECADNRSQRTSTAPHFSELIRPARQAILRARQYLLAVQRSDGSWLGMRHSDASLASQLIFLLTYLERDDSQLIQQAAAAILAEQLPSGGWSPVPNGPADLSTSVQAYFALKLSGAVGAADEGLRRAREVIRSLGGADAADMITRFYLALFGQVEYDHCPAIPPESLRFTGMSHSAALGIVWSHRAERKVDAERGIRELFLRPPSCWTRTAPKVPGLLHWSTILSPFRRFCETLGCTPFRTYALRRAQAHLLRNIAAARIGQLGFSELVWHLIALHALGYAEESAERRTCEQRLREMISIDDRSDLARLQPRTEPIGDTIAVLRSVASSGTMAAHPCVAAAMKWVFEKRQSESEPSATELAGALELIRYKNNRGSDLHESLPPDIGVCRRRSSGRVRRLPGESRAGAGRAIAVMVRRLLDMQQRDGGWAHGRGPSSPDATGAVVEALAPHTDDAVAMAMRRAAAFLRRTQRADGSWDSESGVRLIHGTSLAVRGLLAAEFVPDDEAVGAGINWLLVHQQPCGGWGETANALSRAVDDEYMPGDATATQTAWALRALVAAGRANSAAARRGIEFLLETQRDDGRWLEPQFVWRDAASSRWFRSELHASADSLLALSRWTVAAAAQADAADVSLRVIYATVDD